MAENSWFQVMRIKLSSFYMSSKKIHFTVLADLNEDVRILNVPPELIQRLYRVVTMVDGVKKLSDDERHTLTVLLKVNHGADRDNWYHLINFGRRAEITDDQIAEATRFLLHP